MYAFFVDLFLIFIFTYLFFPCRERPAVIAVEVKGIDDTSNFDDFPEVDLKLRKYFCTLFLLSCLVNIGFTNPFYVVWYYCGNTCYYEYCQVHSNSKYRVKIFGFDDLTFYLNSKLIMSGCTIKQTES